MSQSTLFNNKQRQFLKGLAQQRKVVITIGAKGLTGAVHKEIDSALSHHELLKLRLPTLSKEDSQHLIENICQYHHAALVQRLGRVVSLYRPSDKPHITLP